MEYSYRLIDLFLKFNPDPTHFFLIDIQEEIAFGRKNDVSSVAYLKELRGRYLEIAGRYGAQILNGTLTAKMLENEFLISLQRSMDRV